MPKRCYLRPADLAKHSRHHTAYTSDGPIHEPGKGGQLFKLEFHNGVALDVPENLFQRMKDAGIADLKRPRREDEEEDAP